MALLGNKLHPHTFGEFFAGVVGKFAGHFFADVVFVSVHVDDDYCPGVFSVFVIGGVFDGDVLDDGIINGFPVTEPAAAEPQGGLGIVDNCGAGEVFEEPRKT